MTLKDLKKGDKFKFATANSKRIYEFKHYDNSGNFYYWARFYPYKHFKTGHDKKVKQI